MVERDAQKTASYRCFILKTFKCVPAKHGTLISPFLRDRHRSITRDINSCMLFCFAVDFCWKGHYVSPRRRRQSMRIYHHRHFKNCNWFRTVSYYCICWDCREHTEFIDVSLACATVLYTIFSLDINIIHKATSWIALGLAAHNENQGHII